MIYKFNEYKNFNKVTLDFIDNKITESEFITYLNSEILNEGIIDSIKDFFSDYLIIFNRYLLKISNMILIKV